MRKRADILLRDERGPVSLIIDYGQKEPVVIKSMFPELTGGVLPVADNAPYSSRDANPPYSVDWVDWSAGCGQRTYELPESSFRRYADDATVDISSRGEIAIGPFPLVMDFRSGDIGSNINVVHNLGHGLLVSSREFGNDNLSRRLWYVRRETGLEPQDGAYVLGSLNNGQLSLVPSGDIVVGSTYFYCRVHGELVKVTDMYTWPQCSRGAGGTRVSAHSVDCVWDAYIGYVCRLGPFDANNPGTYRNMPVTDIADDGQYVYVSFHNPASSSPNGFIIRAPVDSDVTDEDSWELYSQADNITRMLYCGGVMYGIQSHYNNGTYYETNIGVFTKQSGVWVFNSIAPTNIVLPDVRIVDMVSCGTYVHVLFASDNRSWIYQVQFGDAPLFQQIVEFPLGFVADGICSHGGMMYVSGRYGGYSMVYAVTPTGESTLVTAIPRPEGIKSIIAAQRWLYLLIENDVYRYDLSHTGYSHYAEAESVLLAGVPVQGAPPVDWYSYFPKTVTPPTDAGWVVGGQSSSNVWNHFVTLTGGRGTAFHMSSNRGSPSSGSGYRYYKKTGPEFSGGATINFVFGGRFDKSGIRPLCTNSDGGASAIVVSNRVAIVRYWLENGKIAIAIGVAGDSGGVDFGLHAKKGLDPAALHSVRLAADSNNVWLYVNGELLVSLPTSSLPQTSISSVFSAVGLYWGTAFFWNPSQQKSNTLARNNEGDTNEWHKGNCTAYTEYSWAYGVHLLGALEGYSLVTNPDACTDIEGWVYMYSSVDNRLMVVPAPLYSQNITRPKGRKRSFSLTYAATLESSITACRLGAQRKSFLYLEVQHSPLSSGQYVAAEGCVDGDWQWLEYDSSRSTERISVFKINKVGREFAYRLHLSDDSPVRSEDSRLVVSRVSLFFVASPDRRQMTFIASMTSKTYAFEHDSDYGISRVMSMAGKAVDVESNYYNGKALVESVVEVPVPTGDTYDKQQARVQVSLRLLDELS